MRASIRASASSRRPSAADRTSARRLSQAAAEPAPPQEKAPAKALNWVVIAFLISLFLPWLWQIGPMSISPYRVILLFMVVPSIFLCAMGKAGALRAADIAIILYCVCAALSMVTIYGTGGAMEPAGTTFIETAGAYFLGRTFIRNANQFRAMTRLLFLIIAVLFPFAIMEAVLNNNILLSLLSKVFPSHVISFADPRWGLRRVQSVFEHPILFGVSAGAILALVHLVLMEKASPVMRWFASGIVLITAALSMSSGPLTALTAQIALLSWNWLLRDNEMRWRILWFLALLGYILISMVSNQTVPEFLMTHFSFDPASAYYRVLIWHFGSASALNHPLFGVGFERWDRPDWMPGSIDMFWLYNAVVFGIPAALFMLGSFLLMVFKVAFVKGLSDQLVRYRTAYVIVMTGYFLVGWTVHFWNATYVLFLFLLGSGSWILEAARENAAGRTPTMAQKPSRSSRRPMANARSGQAAVE